MTRNSDNILPFCQHCGEYKGVGLCKNPECKTKTSEERGLEIKKERCVICQEIAVITCNRCGRRYCDSHAKYMSETNLKSLSQHLGKCIVCGETVCEQCWIFDKKGQVTCQIHSFRLKYVKELET